MIAEHRTATPLDGGRDQARVTIDRLPRGTISESAAEAVPQQIRVWGYGTPLGWLKSERPASRPLIYSSLLTLTFAVDSWSALARCVGEQSGNVAGLWWSVLCLVDVHPCRDVQQRCDAIWQRSHDVQLLYCVRL